MRLANRPPVRLPKLPLGTENTTGGIRGAKLRDRREIIKNLRDQPRDIDRVRRSERELLGERRIDQRLLGEALAIVERARHFQRGNVLAQRGELLFLRAR